MKKQPHKYAVTLTAGKDYLYLILAEVDIDAAAETGKLAFKGKYKRAPESIMIERKE